jgi:hypothetical protein
VLALIAVAFSLLARQLASLEKTFLEEGVSPSGFTKCGARGETVGEALKENYCV